MKKAFRKYCKENDISKERIAFYFNCFKTGWETALEYQKTICNECLEKKVKDLTYGFYRCVNRSCNS